MSSTSSSAKKFIGEELKLHSGFFFPLWALVLPITSVLMLPGIQGTTPGNLFALLLLTPGVALLVMGFSGATNFYRDLAKFALIYVSLNAMGQLSLATLDFPGFGTAQLVNPLDRSVLLRSTLFSQSLYLLTAMVTFTYIKNSYRPAWDKWFMAGAVFLAIYGVYEIVFFLATGSPGDFLTNRRFGDGGFAGSAFQTMAVGPLVIQRFKSLTGEPSMYAFTMLPFWIYALHTGRKYIHWFLLVTLLLTLSTTAYVGIGLYCVLRLIFLRGRDKSLILLLAFILLGGLTAAVMGIQGNPEILKLFDSLFVEKLSGHGASGSDRFGGFRAAMTLFDELPWPNQLVGIGFGYVRSTDFFSTILVNMGIIGLIIFLLIFLIPVFKLGSTNKEIGLKSALLVLMTVAMISVPEYSYLSTWLFLGIAYKTVSQLKRQKQAASTVHSVRGINNESFA